MRVDLAAQVLSSTVSKALQIFGGDAASETARFAEMFDKFFDAVNVSRLDEGKLSRNCFKSPYRSKEDFRLKWLEDVFLCYLNEWERSVNSIDSISLLEKKMMLLPQETLTGLKITVYSFIGLVKYLFTKPDVEFFFSGRICQDPVENFFGQQRHGGTHDNPNVSEFFKNTQALRVVNGFCRDAVKGNCRGSESINRKRKLLDDFLEENVNEPLPKRRYKH